MRTKKKTTELAQEDLDQQPASLGNAMDADDDTDDMDDDLQPDFDAQPVSSLPASLGTELKLPISHSMMQKLAETAEEEGISVMQLCSEFISEGLTKRAWDINVRTSGRNQQPSNNSNNQRFQNQNNNNNNNNRGHYNNNNRGGGGGGGNNNPRQNRQQRQHANNMNIMQDKAAFLEYVRKQEQKRR